MSQETPRRNRIAAIVLDDATIPRDDADRDHERIVAVYDLVEESVFGLPGRDVGPYHLNVSRQGAKWLFAIADSAAASIGEFTLPLAAFRTPLRDYFVCCDTYYSAIRTAGPRQIEAIDRERSSLHNAGADVVLERLAGVADIDRATARRIFTLIAALQWKG